MAVSPGQLCTTASEAYKNWMLLAKWTLLWQVEELFSKEIPVTSRDIRRNGARISS